MLIAAAPEEVRRAQVPLRRVTTRIVRRGRHATVEAALFAFLPDVDERLRRLHDHPMTDRPSVYSLDGTETNIGNGSGRHVVRRRRRVAAAVSEKRYSNNNEQSERSCDLAASERALSPKMPSVRPAVGSCLGRPIAAPPTGR